MLLVLACILMPQKMANAAGNAVPTAVDNLTVSLRNKVSMAVTDSGYMRVAYDAVKFGWNIMIHSLTFCAKVP